MAGAHESSMERRPYSVQYGESFITEELLSEKRGALPILIDSPQTSFSSIRSYEITDSFRIYLGKEKACGIDNGRIDDDGEVRDSGE